MCLMNLCFFLFISCIRQPIFISCLLFLRFLFLRISCVKYIYTWSKSAYPLLFRRFLFSSKLSIPLYFIPTTSPLGREKMSWTKPLSSLTWKKSIQLINENVDASRVLDQTHVHMSISRIMHIYNIFSLNWHTAWTQINGQTTCLS